MFSHIIVESPKLEAKSAGLALSSGVLRSAGLFGKTNPNSKTTAGIKSKLLARSLSTTGGGVSKASTSAAGKVLSARRPLKREAVDMGLYDDLPEPSAAENETVQPTIEVSGALTQDVI